MIMNHDEVGPRIRYARCMKGKSQAELATAMGCSCGHVVNIEDGKTSMRLSEVVLAANYLGVHPYLIMTGICGESIELAKLLSNRTQDRVMTEQYKTLIELTKCLFKKPQHYQQKLLGVLKSILELA